MPQVTVTLAEGRTPEQIRDLVHEVHAAVLRTVNTRPEYIRVVVHEVPRTHWATGDVTLAERGLPRSNEVESSGKDAASAKKEQP
ncbi:4-oxalocrotonate tautomerase family protein [Streptomyces phyllanthi]|uniref:4-oxalocrotonate tautomerase n=1 Tax=Streptomyces phyllanthi TaxID=1803180 RepID=A0A5N8W0A4_9ACTN|nr:tautomerase family protein [Streptomyces phyllanthi]MPY40933.1 4-oxalocrotonate tautomerase [Streptomyces phyllanthi]